MTAPHLLGPWLARRLDQARNGRVALTAAFAAYGGAMTAATLLLGRAPLALVGAAVVASGACGPLLTGGLSSRLAGLAGAGERAKRRAEGWDAVSYGLAGTLGPAVVAALVAPPASTHAVRRPLITAWLCPRPLEIPKGIPAGLRPCQPAPATA